MESDKPVTTRPRKAAQPAAPPRRRRGGDARGIADLISSIGETSFRKFGFIQSSLVSRWAEIAGPRYAAMASPESIAFARGKKADGTLHLVVTSATAIFMQHAEPEIIARVNRFFGYAAVARVRYRHGTLTPHIAPADGLKPIADPELQTVLESLARSLEEKEAREAAAKAPRPAPVQLRSDNLKPVRLFAPPLPDEVDR
ncbi:DciA family protein [Blastomonas sp. UPD001]|uniref:DUF721 domain-containing protein n=1 Tax=Blastomonas sp. UPD001 TaxID=2217673 RepID=UPI001E4695F8|nr:DciA family protein [Blastomonas sp. UPD001]